MQKLCIFMGMMIFSSIGWWLGAMIGFWSAWVLSGIGSMLGVYIGWRIDRDYL